MNCENVHSGEYITVLNGSMTVSDMIGQCREVPDGRIGFPMQVVAVNSPFIAAKAWNGQFYRVSMVDTRNVSVIKVSDEYAKSFLPLVKDDSNLFKSVQVNC